MYKFRGYDNNSKQFVYGICINQTPYSTSILDQSSGNWTYVSPETTGRRIILSDSTHTEVYNGDIVRYSFTHKGETYHKYFKICENDYDLWAEELWRDHELDCETFEVTRFHNVKYAGTRKDITSFNTRTAWTVIGNIWQNPELL